MKCLICGFDGLETGDVCPSCHVVMITPYCWPTGHVMDTIPGLEKIEPLKGGLTAINKLNEVIEKVNKIIDYMDQQVMRK